MIDHHTNSHPSKTTDNNIPMSNSTHKEDNNINDNIQSFVVDDTTTTMNQNRSSNSNSNCSRKPSKLRSFLSNIIPSGSALKEQFSFLQQSNKDNDTQERHYKKNKNTLVRQRSEGLII